jgi:branched-chain amino acid transport system substrate-binding protein
MSKINSIMISFLLAVTFIFLISCETAPKKAVYHPEKVTASAQQEYLGAKKSFDSKDNRRALIRLKKFVQLNPNSELTPNAYFLMGQIYTENQDFANALASYRSASVADNQIGADAEIRATKIALKLGQIEDAKMLIEAFGARAHITRDQGLAMSNLHLDYLLKQNKNFEALPMILALADAETNPKAKQAQQLQALEIVESRLSLDEVREVADRPSYGRLQIPAKFRVGSSLFEQGSFGRAKYYLQDIISSAPNSAYFERARSMISVIDSRDKVESKTIGLVVPLSGKRAVVGYKTLRGVQLGLGIYGKSVSNFKLAVIDSEMNPDYARKAVEKLVLEDNVIAIIGGVESKTAGAEAAKAQELGIPFIALSQKPRITEIGDSIFRNALTGAMLVQKLVDVAMNELHMSRFAIMFPNDPYGVEYANLFWDQVRANGGSITAAQAYNPKDSDFAPYIQRLVDTYYVEDRTDEYKLRLKSWEEKNQKKTRNTEVPTYEKLLPPNVDFDAIFIPDSAQALTSIASYLPYYDVDNIYLLGTNIWNSPALLNKPELRKSLERSIFVDSFLTSDKSFQNSEFFSSYKKVFSEDPGIFEVQAYDSALILKQLIQSGADSRASIISKLQNLKNFPGALGPLSISANREIYRPVIDLKIQNGQIVQLSKQKNN